MKTYLFVQDHQMYYNSIIKFTSEKEIPVDILDKCSSGNGRISLTFREFCDNLKNESYEVNPENIEHSELFDGFYVCPVVYGCRGNY